MGACGAGLIGCLLLFPLGFRAKLDTFTIIGLLIQSLFAVLIAMGSWRRGGFTEAVALGVVITNAGGLLLAALGLAIHKTLPVRPLKWISGFAAVLFWLSFAQTIHTFRTLVDIFRSLSTVAFLSSILLPPVLLAYLLWRADRMAPVTNDIQEPFTPTANITVPLPDDHKEMPGDD